MFEKRYFDVVPKIVRAEHSAEIIIKGLVPHHDFRRCTDLKVSHVGGDGLTLGGTVPNWGFFAPIEEFKVAADGGLTLVCQFDGEGEHTIRIEGENNGRHFCRYFKIYALAADLFNLRPFRGDCHVHTRYSACSQGAEDPAYAAAVGRRLGLDFMALTDHCLYEPSLEAVAQIAKWPTYFKVFPGEEVHHVDLPNLHFVNFGGKASVNAMIRQNEAADFRSEVAAMAKNFPVCRDIEEQKLMAASSWIFKKIHEVGGLAVFCHPMWHPVERFNLPSAVCKNIYDRMEFDAVELIGSGMTPDRRESTQLNVSFYYQQCIEKGRLIPVVGDTDSHWCERQLLHSQTIAFAKDNSYEEICRAIRGCRSVAGEFISGEFPHIYGNPRLVSFAYFLNREYFPEHDELCAAEGEIMIAALIDGAEGEKLAQYSDLNERLFSKYYQR